MYTATLAKYLGRDGFISHLYAFCERKQLASRKARITKREARQSVRLKGFAFFSNLLIDRFPSVNTFCLCHWTKQFSVKDGLSEEAEGVPASLLLAQPAQCNLCLLRIAYYSSAPTLVKILHSCRIARSLCSVLTRERMRRQRSKKISEDDRQLGCVTFTATRPLREHLHWH